MRSNSAASSITPARAVRQLALLVLAIAAASATGCVTVTLDPDAFPTCTVLTDEELTDIEVCMAQDPPCLNPGTAAGIAFLDLHCSETEGMRTKSWWQIF